MRQDESSVRFQSRRVSRIVSADRVRNVRFRHRGRRTIRGTAAVGHRRTGGLRSAAVYTLIHGIKYRDIARKFCLRRGGLFFRCM